MSGPYALIYELNRIFFIRYFFFLYLDSNVMCAWVVGSGGGEWCWRYSDVSCVRPLHRHSIPHCNNERKEKLDFVSIIFYPVAAKIDKFQAQARTMLIMLCH